ncbi:centaurin beta [Annulohypoxylon truncatum]|uniref:centaurin beta n=1 Tax=Annulohypoxylon truncatum TaxID=327061 RepID=UPI0020089BE2|nr:centaurin beta [Annulohypoxylon truncatum]KAI1213924.1 centaurin beta [Annulohypoxylon truncatum]
MGIVSSRLDDGAAIYLRDQNRLSIASVVITCPRKRISTTIVPNAFPATRATATRSPGDSGLVEFIQDTEPSAVPNFLLKLNNDDELIFNFTFVIRQEDGGAGIDTHINGLTYVYASTNRDLENLVTREFHADPNLHKNANVELVGDYTTGGSASVTFEWSWKWKPPKGTEDGGGGWRNVCSFVEYDQRAHRLDTLARFSFWVANTSPFPSHPNSPSPAFQLAVPPRIRVPSSQSVESRISEQDEPSSPVHPQSDALSIAPTIVPGSRDSVKLDISCPRPGEDMTVSDDGPVFRATIKALEQKTGNMRTQMKKVLKKAEHAYTTQTEANEAFVSFTDALREASATNANAVQPAIDHYFDKISREILNYERQNTLNLQKIIIEPISKLYTYDIKQAESKRRDFEEESKDYYSYVSRYLGQRQDSVKTKKLAESDSKYQTKRRNFELKRFDYSSFMQDLHGGRKEQEVLSHLTKYADIQARGFLATAQRIENLLPQLEALANEVQEADKEFQYQRREREEKRRVLEKSNLQYNEPEGVTTAVHTTANPSSNGNQHTSDSELGRADSTSSQLKPIPTGNSGPMASAGTDLSRSPGSVGHASLHSPAQTSKFKGIRDLEERDFSQLAIADKNSTHRKEGLLWALNRPGTHVDPLSLNKQGWHKFWVVLDQGKLSEYSNWKQKLDLHMDPIDLRMASVREARNAERRFCFEVITPQYKRVYQATSGEDMNSWILSINNALQSAVEGRGLKEKPLSPGESTTSLKRDIGSILTGKSSSLNHGSHHGSHNNTSSAPPSRRTTVGARPANARAPSSSYDEHPDKLLQMLRDNDQGNCWCADCGSGSKVEWVSINLAIILCIECSGIHRSLGTHISKVRSLTLDITSFTPDIIELLLLVGNRVSNMVWEAKLDPNLKPGPQATREQRLKFITAKYVDRAYVEPISATLSRYPTADETLLAAIKRNEIQQVIYALALRANPNTLDKSRGTHPIFLALAAADPASPSPTTPVTGRPEPDSRVIPFPVAEMLIQNGAEIPAAMPAFPLSRSAQMYLEQKRGRSAAIEASGASLPGSLSPSPSERLQRDKDARLQKRISAGGRLAKSPIPER